MQLISDEYRKLNTQLHIDKKNYGKTGSRWALIVYKIAAQLKSKDVLDYGCGKSTLSLHLPFSIQQYDPSNKKYAELPRPADIVICTDVLEHVEPELLDNVLFHIASLLKKKGLLSACTVPAKKELTDGRNAHLIQQKPDWWFNKIAKYFDIFEFKHDEIECVFFVEPKQKGV